MSHVQRSIIPEKSRGCFIRAHAKINLTLDVLGRRADGYHELATVMQEIDLYDTLCLTASDESRVQLVCSVPELSGPANLAARAAEMVRGRLGLEQGVNIELLKRIPLTAGLGGGSSDAAAVLLALQRWWQLPVGDHEAASEHRASPIQEIAEALGSDVPFFLTGGLALCEGRGERVRPLEAHLPATLRWLLLLKPAIGISTAPIFRNLSVSDYSDGSHSRAVVAALLEGRCPRAEDLHNGLERGVLEHYPEVARAREAMLQAGAPLVRLSGSGPTLFAPFAHMTEALTVQQRLQAQGYEVYLSRAVSPNPGNMYLF
ncbi:MAG TPA: 4-(cytidine 5'-diphospho)-2-C-methyl-D-erythritol kinase [Ktedonobacteraceae bacterium]|nr:4-(cytidine 5'-diphospho)-2-C-methyl-D-erythritol kinase [Ktedonobacteraceae bacterium]